MRWIPLPILPLVLAAALVACRQQERGMEAPPPAALIAPVGEHMPLEQQLGILEAELQAALEGRLEDPVSRGHLLRAEAITDRLLETRLPFEWLDNGYYVESRLRQIQSLADRIVAHLRRGEDRPRALAETMDLYRQVRELREALESGRGGTAPPPLDTLLGAYRGEGEG